MVLPTIQVATPLEQGVVVAEAGDVGPSSWSRSPGPGVGAALGAGSEGSGSNGNGSGAAGAGSSANAPDSKAPAAPVLGGAGGGRQGGSA